MRSELAREAYLLRLLIEMQPQEQCYVWTAWVEAVARLGFEDLVPLAHEVLDRGLSDRQALTPREFEELLQIALDGPDRMAAFNHDRIGPADDLLERLSQWSCFSRDYDKPKPQPLNKADHIGHLLPVENPTRYVGRNDACPCGSGKKYKKCCLPRTQAV